jgi:hypothetical protein
VGVAVLGDLLAFVPAPEDPDAVRQLRGLI